MCECGMRMAQRVCEIGVCARLPRRPLGGEHLVAQMPRCDLRTHGRASAHVKLNDGLGHLIPQHLPIPLQELCAEVRRAEPRTLEREKRHLLRGVEPAQVRIEFQTVDDARPE